MRERARERARERDTKNIFTRVVILTKTEHKKKKNGDMSTKLKKNDNERACKECRRRCGRKGRIERGKEKSGGG